MFNVDKTKLLELLDEALVQKGASIPVNSRASDIPMGRVIERKGETAID